jgi:DNA-binding response OmpR family regulator
MAHVLICGNDAELLSSRGLVLSHAGFTVVIACTDEEISQLPENPAVALGVVGHSLNDAEQKTVAKDLRSRWPDVRILYLNKTPHELEKLSETDYRVSSNDPTQFIAVCREIIAAD